MELTALHTHSCLVNCLGPKLLERCQADGGLTWPITALFNCVLVPALPQVVHDAIAARHGQCVPAPRVLLLRTGITCTEATTSRTCACLSIAALSTSSRGPQTPRGGLPEGWPTQPSRELLAIYLAVKHFRHFLEGRQFHICTDHKPLTYAIRNRSQNHSPRQLRHLSLPVIQDTPPAAAFQDDRDASRWQDAPEIRRAVGLTVSTDEKAIMSVSRSK